MLVYESPLTSDTDADHVFGQDGSFTTGAPNQGGRDAGSISFPEGLTLDGAGNLFVADSGNNRVLVYDDPLTTDKLADHVFGQDGFFTTGDINRGGLDATSLDYPADVAVHAGGDVYVADQRNSRVLYYQSPLATDKLADRVYGQDGSFATAVENKGGVDAGSLRLATRRGGG